LRDEHLRRQADRAPLEGGWFLGSALADYQARRGLSDAALAAELGIDLDVLDLLRLCRRPAGPADYEAIARRFGVPADVLWRVAGQTGEAAPAREGAGDAASGRLQ
jgi:hypothetical protein